MLIITYTVSVLSLVTALVVPACVGRAGSSIAQAGPGGEFKASADSSFVKAEIAAKADIAAIRGEVNAERLFMALKDSEVNQRKRDVAMRDEITNVGEVKTWLGGILIYVFIREAFLLLKYRRSRRCPSGA